jgi:cytochrome oxidase Cu insertion factor (SCO1/SenC/PrrC family)
MIRWISTVAIALLIALVVGVQSTPIGRRGSEMHTRSEAPGALLAIGDAFPALALQNLDGTPFDVSSLQGHRVLITFERSVDW